MRIAETKKNVSLSLVRPPSLFQLQSKTQKKMPTGLQQNRKWNVHWFFDLKSGRRVILLIKKLPVNWFGEIRNWL